MAKPGVGIVFAEHPTDLGPDNRKAPILVAGRLGRDGRCSPRSTIRGDGGFIPANRRLILIGSSN